MIPDVLVPDGLVCIGDGELEVPSREGLRVPEAWMRVDVGLKGIKSIYRIALDGAASKRVAVAMPANPNNLKLILVKFIFVINHPIIYMHLSCEVGCS